MSNDPRRTSGGSWALQGCLYGAVALFVVLLLLMIFLAYRRFRENTDVVGRVPPASAPALVTVALHDDG